MIILLGSSLSACTSPPTANPTPEEEIYLAGDAAFTASSLPIQLPALVLADFDQDGHLDLASAGEPNLTIYRGDGDGGFTRQSQATAGVNPVDLAAVDINEDGFLDLVIANHDTDFLTILLGSSDMEFSPAPNSPLHIAVSPHPHAVQAADLDRDGHVDLVIDHRDGEGLLVLKGNGDGSFIQPGILVDMGGDPYRGMAIGDINGDELLDMLTPNPAEVGVVVQDVGGDLLFNLLAPAPAEAPFAAELGDFNRDGYLDLIAASDEGSARVELFWGDGSGVFSLDAGPPFELAPGGKNIVVGDFNGDGFSDAVVCSYQSTEIMVLLGGEDSMQVGFLPGIEHPWGLAAGDLNEDGHTDLIVADDTAGLATVFLSTTAGE